ncbi:MAG TPA: methyltransferase domain-containing protein [Candidatus Lokiarchaeia archaeon]|nr:methyltransferase domain-containing protein [Candidatus Lokiarchaeia archaeon]
MHRGRPRCPGDTGTHVFSGMLAGMIGAENVKNAGPDVWADPTIIDAARSIELCEQLEQRARFPDQIEINNSVLALLDAKAGESWLEVGCGSGVLCRQLAKQLMPDGFVTGVDLSEEMIARAKEYAQIEGPINNLQFQPGDAAVLPFLDGSFDGAFSARLMLHAQDPVAIMREMARVVAGGGKLVAMEWDFDSITVDHSDRDLTRKILHWRTDFKDGNNWIGRQLWRHALDAAWQDIAFENRVSVAHDKNMSLVQSLIKAANGARDADVITAEESSAWLEEIDQKIDSGKFFASIVYFMIRGTK